MPQHATLSGEIAADLRRDILTQRYRPQDRLPSERDLAASYSASRGAVREALSQLEQLGLITIQPGGARVQPVESARIAVLGPLLGLHDTPDATLVDQFLQTFGALASLTTREAVAQADRAQLQDLQDRLVDLRQVAGSLQDFQPPWVALLEALSAISDNLVVKLIGNDLKAQFVGEVMKHNFKPEIARNDLLEILQQLDTAFQRKDKELAHGAVTRYFDTLRVAIMEVLGKRLAS